MKKIININLSGRVIPIEDAAYESLQRYIESLRRYFAAEEGRDEIINDIESRIAELMNDKVRRGADAVTESDIDEIIGTMGRVEDFEQADAAEPAAAATGGQTFSNAHTASTASSGKRFKGRLYRDSSDKMLGGVCSGLASYMNIDPAIVRLLFAIVTLGGFGFGIPIYILLWIVLPARSLEDFVGKRLFRNPEERILGGVAGGLAAYFNKEVWVFRLIFAAPLLLNILISIISALTNGFDGPENIFVGSFTGTFTLAYIVLWIVLPEARSPFERMEMRGEKVDVNRIWQNVQQNMSGFENRAKAWGEEVTSTASNLGNQAGRFASTRGRSFAAEVAQSGRTVGRGIGHIIGVLFKAFFLFVFGIIAFFLFIAVVAFTAGGLARPVNDFILNGFWQKAFMWGTLVFFLAVPLIAIITWIVRRLMKVRSQKRYLGWTFGGLWTLGWISLFLLIATVGKDFRNYDSVPQNITLSQPAMNKMLVRVDEPRIRYSGTFAWINDDHDDSGWDLTEDSLRLAHVKLRVQKSPDQMYHVTIWRYSRGRNRNEAAARAERLAYTAASSDSSLILGSGYGVGRLQKFRAQRVIVEIQVPAGKQIRFDESVQNKLQGPVHVRHTSNGRWNNNEWEEGWDEENHYYFQWQPNTDYTMTETGELVDMSRSTTTESTDTYRYRGDSLDNQIQELQRQRDEENRRRDEEIERQRQRVEEENRRLQELQNTSTTENTSRVTRRNKPAIETTGIHTPIFSLII